MRQAQNQHSLRQKGMCALERDVRPGRYPPRSSSETAPGPTSVLEVIGRRVARVTWYTRVEKTKSAELRKPVHDALVNPS